ncbi:hypothetical protein [Sphingomonas sp. S-NIH.Pt1_0416]|uniref:hypothetical protein n=1 Tax=Sphingomonas sp. S-NIH.Pt1_0416 TaxID=1920123 RepID=UPI000F7EBA70|nr:hypothetical protein [Sphingomonas sp. S-NIH.Pt1_0416]
MSRGLAKAAQIVGVVVAIAAAIPTGGGSTLLAGALGVGAGTASAIAAGVGLATSALSALTACRPPGGGGNAPTFTPAHLECPI